MARTAAVRRQPQTALQTGRVGCPDPSERSHVMPPSLFGQLLDWHHCPSGAFPLLLWVQELLITCHTSHPWVRAERYVEHRRTIELAKQYRSIGQQCYVLPDATTSSAEAIREYMAQKARAGGPRLAESVVSSIDGKADPSTLLQESRSGGDVVTSGSSSPQGKRVLFEFHRMSSYR